MPFYMVCHLFRSIICTVDFSGLVKPGFIANLEWDLFLKYAQGFILSAFDFKYMFLHMLTKPMLILLTILKILSS